MRVLRFRDSSSDCKEEYIERYGKHFNLRLCDYAVLKMKKNDREIVPITKELVDLLLSEFGIRLEHSKMWDYVYVANMCKADFYGSSIIDDEHMAMYIKDVIDDEDGYEGIVFCRWCADIKHKNITVDWLSML